MIFSDCVIGLDRGVEHALLLVGDAQLEIVGGERRLRREPRGGEIGGAGLGGRDVALDGAADAAPEIGDPARRRRESANWFWMLPPPPPPRPLLRLPPGVLERCAEALTRSTVGK